MSLAPDILCIGSVLWDVIGRAKGAMRIGFDVPGRIERVPGGVAMNIAMTLRRFDLTPALLSAVGRDDEGHDLVAAAARLGLLTDYLYRSDDLPTDIYMAIEGAGALVAAIADAHSLEMAGSRILAPLQDGRLGDAATPYAGPIALDGNLTEGLLADMARAPFLSAADLRIAPASPGKVGRLRPLLPHPGATFYLNLEEAGLLLNARFAGARAAACAMLDQGARRVVITDGDRAVALATPNAVFEATPPKVLVTRVTGAGDTFMAAHIAAELRGEATEMALQTALDTAVAYVSGDAH